MNCANTSLCPFFYRKEMHIYTYYLNHIYIYDIKVGGEESGRKKQIKGGKYTKKPLMCDYASI